MINDLKVKLSSSIHRKLEHEEQVVYILSRIRKIIEKEGIRTKYKLLNIYCNWSLHTSIDNTDDIKDILSEFINKAETRHHLLLLEDFKNQFNEFVKEILEINLETTYLQKFNELLTDVISDTPISIKETTKTTIIINPADLPRGKHQITYKILRD